MSWIRRTRPRIGDEDVDGAEGIDDGGSSRIQTAAPEWDVECGKQFI